MIWHTDLGDLIRRLFGRPRVLKPSTVPPRPADWKLTYADLVAEMKAGKRSSISRAEMEWAKEYERSLIPEGVRFPRKGDLYEALRERPVEYLTAWAAPYTGGGSGTLNAGEQVWVYDDPGEERPVGVYVLPVRYKEVEERMVPETERTAAKYGGFYLYFSTVELNADFRLVRTGFKGKRP